MSQFVDPKYHDSQIVLRNELIRLSFVIDHRLDLLRIKINNPVKLAQDTESELLHKQINYTQMWYDRALKRFQSIENCVAVSTDYKSVKIEVLADMEMAKQAEKELDDIIAKIMRSDDDDDKPSLIHKKRSKPNSNVDK